MMISILLLSNIFYEFRFLEVFYIMFNRDLDHFRSPEGYHRNMAPEPHGPPPSRGPHPPHFGPFPPPPPFGAPPPLPIDRDAFQDIRNFIETAF